MSDEPIGAHLKPLGVFGVAHIPGPATLWPLVGAIPPKLRRPILKHLSRGVHVGVGMMGFWPDLLQDRRPDWSLGAHKTDGVYFWSVEAGPYIREYGIGLPPEVIEHCLFGVTDETLDWVRAHKKEIGRYLDNTLWTHRDADAPRNPRDAEPPLIETVDISALRVIGDIDINSDNAVEADRSWLDRLLTHPTDPQHRVVSGWYLDGCTTVLRRPSRIDDIIRTDWTKVAPNAIQTDGKYLWRSDYAHYVRMHGAALPKDLEQRSLQYRPAPLAPEAIDEVREAVHSGALRDPARQWTPTADR